ncbi:MAG: helix-turn-helix domain-containing protein, partial [Methylocella sp.]
SRADAEAQPKSRGLPDGPFNFKDHLQVLEIELLQSALKECRFNQKKTAEFLGMTYHQLRGYLRKYGLTDAGNEEGI